MRLKNIYIVVNPKLITFDVTGTLLKTNIEKSYGNVADKFGIELKHPNLLTPSFRNNFLNESERHPNFGKQGIGWQNWWLNVVRNVFKDQDPNLPDELLSKVAHTLIKDYETAKCWEKCPGAEDLLEYLNKRKILVGVISNFDERLKRILESVKFANYFQFILTSYEFGKEKPDQMIFDEALKLGGSIAKDVIQPQDALHIGNDFDLDYLGAKTAGWNSIFIRHGFEFSEEMINIPRLERFKSLDELKRYLDVLLKYE